MCGIAGTFAYAVGAPPVSAERLRRIRDAMAARGPDASDQWLSDDGRIGLAHRRLAIIDLSDRGRQPMATADGRFRVVFNGEIYNHRELRRTAEARGHVFRSESDTEVLLALYALEGEAMLARLRGMFAFAMWDTQARSLLLARDRFGIKPLYYVDRAGSLEFASSVRALCGVHADQGLDPAAQVGFLIWGAVPEGRTLHFGIRELPAGHVLKVHRSGSLSIRPWGTVVDLVTVAEGTPFRGSREEAVEACAAEIAASVRAHCVSDVPVGLFLSSGIDSTVIAAAQPREARFKAVTLGFHDAAASASDEIPLARRVAEALDVEHHAQYVSAAEFRDFRADFLSAMDQPSIDGINTWLVSRTARQLGLKVALSGLGGDELFGSYPSFRDVPRLLRLARPFRGLHLIGRTARALVAPILRRWTSPKYAGVLEYGGTPGGAYLLRRALYMPWELDTLLPAEVVRQGLVELGLPESVDRSVARLRETRNQVALLELSFYMRHQLLRDSDWASMAHSIEVRVPFVDDAVVQTVLSCRTRYPDLSKREVLRHLAPELHALVGRQPKLGFTVPVQAWLRQEGRADAAEGSRGMVDRGLRLWARRVLAVQSASNPVTMTGLAFPAAAVPFVSGVARRRRRVLVSTIAPSGGGVGALMQFTLDVLRARGLEPVIAHYEPFSKNPALSVPSFALLTRSVGREVRLSFGDIETHALGSWLPELEFTNYWPSDHWHRLIDSCSAGLAVSGNVLPATPFARSGHPFVAWIASDWTGDRKDRVAAYPPARRLLDRIVVQPVMRRLEPQLLCAGKILSLSEYTRRMLQDIAPCDIGSDILPMPVDALVFTPEPQSLVPQRVGFFARYDDPRKNVELLLAAAARLRARFPRLEVIIAGGELSERLTGLATRLGVADLVDWRAHLPRDEMLAVLRSLDAFVVPSHQEGLCIAALEAMACGVPVVSTRCGGPEEFVIPGETGELCGFDADDMADAIARVLSDPARRDRMGAAARRLVETRYSRAHAEKVLVDALRTQFPDLPLR